MKEKRYVLYIHTNLKNNKKYIGITCQKPENRWNYGKGYLRNKHLSGAIKKYGWNGFSHDVVLVNLTKEEAEMFEIEIIKFYNTTNQNLGYNLTSGGSLGSKHSQQTIKKMSRNRKGINNPNFGKKMSQETKDKISKANKGNKLGPLSEERKRKIRESNQKRNVSDKTKEKIRKAITGHVKSKETVEKLRVAGFKRKQSEETRNKISRANKGKVRTKEHVERMKISHKGKHSKPKYKVENITTGEIFDSVKIASQKYKVCETCISRACNKIIKTSCGCEWRYVE